MHRQDFSVRHRLASHADIAQQRPFRFFVRDVVARMILGDLRRQVA